MWSTSDITNPFLYHLEKANPILDKITSFDEIAIQHFESASYSDLCDFFNKFRETCNMNYLIHGEFLDKSNRGYNFQLSQSGLNKILLLFAVKCPSDLIISFKYGLRVEDQKTLIEIAKLSKRSDCLNYFHITDEEERAQIAKVCIKEGNPAKFLIKENFISFSIENKRLREELCETLAEVRPDLFIKNLDLFGPIDGFLKQNLLLKCIPQLKYITAGKIKETIDLYSIRLKINASQFKGIDSERIKTLSLESSNSEEKILNIFNKITENPGVELYGRAFWRSNQQSQISATSNNCSLLTQCVMTNDAIVKAIFGPNVDEKLQALKLSKEKNNFSELVSLIQINESKLKNRISNDFFSYSFFLNKRGLEHFFVVLQYLGEGNKIRYRILQSWLFEHTLKEYMEHRANSLSQSQFCEFLQEFEHMLMHPFWTHQFEIFCFKYFMFEPKSNLNTPNISSWELEVKYGISDLESINSIEIQFEMFKKAHMKIS